MRRFIRYKDKTYRAIDGHTAVEELYSNLVKAEEYIKKAASLKQKVIEELPTGESGKAFEKLRLGSDYISSARRQFSILK